MRQNSLAVKAPPVPSRPRHAEAHPSSFSRPSHFALILAPVLLSAILSLTQDESRSPLFRLAIFVLLTATLSAGIAILTALRRSEEM